MNRTMSSVSHAMTSIPYNESFGGFSSGGGSSEYECIVKVVEKSKNKL